MNICVIGGAGYVGLATGLGLSQIGHQVINVDVNEERIAKLSTGQSPIFEDGIESILKQNLDSGRIKFSTDLTAAVADSSFVFIAVGTPPKDDGQADLTQITQVAHRLSECLDDYKLLILKSTVPADAIGVIRSILGKNNTEGKNFDIVSNPEFLREGRALHDFFFPDRIVVGSSSDQAKATLRDMYGPILAGNPPWKNGEDGRSPKPVPMIETDVASAQMIKYTANAFLATRISFINEIAGLCESIGADVEEVVRGLADDPRIGSSYLNAGLGFGGPCLEKDLDALIKIAENYSYDPQMFRAVMERNQKQVGTIVVKLKQLTGGGLRGLKIAVFGLSFKAGTSDVRNSLAIKVIEDLEQEGAMVSAHDPMARWEAHSVAPNLECFDDPYQAANDAHGLLILTEWPEFKTLDYNKIKESMSSPVIVDGRNLLDPRAMTSMGFSYIGVGRGNERRD